MITIERKIHFQAGRHTRKELREGDSPPTDGRPENLHPFGLTRFWWPE